MKFKKFLCGLFLLSTVSSLALADEINLYDQPNNDSKPIGKIDMSAGIMPIYTPKDSTWIKVADPRNGNVGWVKSNDLKGAKNKITFTQKIINNDNGTYQVFEFGQSPSLSPKPSKAMLDQIKLNNENAARYMRQNMQNMMREMQEMNSYFQHEWQHLQTHGGFPMMPIVVVPGQMMPGPVIPKHVSQQPTSTMPKVNNETSKQKNSDVDNVTGSKSTK